MRKIIIKKNRTIAALLTLLMFGAFLIGVVPAQEVSAQSNNKGSFIDGATLKDVKDRQKYYWLRACFGTHDIDKVPRSEMKNWEFFKGSGSAFEYNIVGNIYGANDSATWSCESGENVKTAFASLGVTSPREAFCSIDGARYDGADNFDKQTCVTGAGDGEWDNKAEKKAETQLSSFEEKARGWAPEVVKPINDIQNYVRYYESFMKQCDVSLQSGAYQEGSADADNKYMVPVINGESDKVQNKLGVGISSKDSQVAIVAAIGSGGTGFYEKGEQGTLAPFGVVVTCNKAAQDLRDYAPAYLAYFNANKDTLEEADATGNSSANTKETTCEGVSAGMGWFGCQILRVIDGAVSFLDNAVSSLLFIEGDYFESQQVEAGWRVMRNLALIVLLPMMFFMVIGTALGGGPFDPYTVKKALPRMLIAVIFIALSLPLTQFAVQLSNAAGSGIGNLITSAMPDQGKVENLTDIFEDANGEGLFTTGVVTYVGAASLSGGLTLGVMGSFALVTLIALLIGFVILTIRQVLVLALIVIAPLAILVWIFPGNDKLWKIWKGTFTAMLLMYPVIALLIFSGRFFAGLVQL